MLMSTFVYIISLNKDIKHTNYSKAKDNPVVRIPVLNSDLTFHYIRS